MRWSMYHLGLLEQSNGATNVDPLSPNTTHQDVGAWHDQFPQIARAKQRKREREEHEKQIAELRASKRSRLSNVSPNTLDNFVLPNQVSNVGIDLQSSHGNGEVSIQIDSGNVPSANISIPNDSTDDNL